MSNLPNLLENKGYPEVELLFADDEAELFARLQSGDQTARDEIILRSMPWMKRIALDTAKMRRMRVDDLIQEGFIGLVESMARYDPTRGLRFYTYARWWVVHYIKKFVEKNLRIVTPPQTRIVRKVRHQSTRKRRELERLHGRTISDQEVADALGVPLKEIHACTMFWNVPDLELVSPDTAAREPSNGFFSNRDATWFSSSEDPGPETTIIESEERERLRRGMETLTERERIIVERQFLEDEAVPLRVIGKELGISNERVRQLRNRAVAKLKEVA